MIGLVVTGHANFASGMTSSVNLIAGEQEAYRYIDFLPTYSLEDLSRELTKAMDELKDCEGILVFADLMGGTPFKTAVEVGFPRGNVNVLAGTNLPMLLEIVMSRKFIEDLEDLTQTALEVGAEGVARYTFQKIEDVEPEDGI
ncbi:MAG: PTS galactosamine/N-acetylgalactosamine transporter subunit IIA [Butyricicoccus pullicaecorum]|nr:PTS sugar transporter subunit IIA [Butyricicoccus pullicaecorum]MDO4668659.1 PTS galactosamine/N-acetylgalactosamine transporter subunit IIA [Butyricicoccus pullicaecorum]